MKTAELLGTNKQAAQKTEVGIRETSSGNSVRKMCPKTSFKQPNLMIHQRFHKVSEKAFEEN